jgi:ATP-binding cassette subfamily B protein
MLADRVALLHEGRIGAVGTHSELLETSAAYRSVISSLADTDQSPRADRAVTDSTIELEIIESAGLDDDARLVHREDGDKA